jgi:hypothetical protein
MRMRTNRRSERGISLLLAIFALVMLTAIAMGMMYMSSTESSINSNFKAEETSYFAARAGIEEVRDRMLAANPNTISALLPTGLPTTTGGVVYVLQNGVTAADITNFGSNNPLVDDELCHDFSYGGMSSQPANIRCSTQPGGAWFTTTPSIAPYALDYKWVRVTMKANNSAPYAVDGAQPLTSQVCWNGTSEVARAAGCAGAVPTANPVYMVTALAVSPSGARRMVQEEISQTPLPSFPYGLFATGTGCGALTLAGGAQTFSFNSATQNPPTNPPSNATNSGGNVGSNGNINFNGSTTKVNGNTGSALPGIGNCNSGNGITGTPSQYGTAATIPTQTLPTPPLPNPLPPTKGCPTYCYNSSTSLGPGSYGNVNVTGGATLTLSGGTPSNPAVYTMNSLTLSGGSTLVINGTVVINIAGIGQNNPINFSGGSFQNNSFVPSNFVINYGGTNNVSIAGGSAAFAVINAPNANVSFSGGSSFFGQAIGRTISNVGGTNIYYDTSLNTGPPNNSSFYQIAMRELSY